MDEIMKEWTKPQVLLNGLSGLGLGLLLAALVPGLAYNGVLLGIILIAAGIGGAYMMKKK